MPVARFRGGADSHLGAPDDQHERIIEMLIINALIDHVGEDEMERAATMAGVHPLRETGSSELTELDEVETFDSEGVLTTDRGVVLRFGDGSEFQISIGRSRNPREG